MNARCIDFPEGYCCECVPPYYGNGLQCVENGDGFIIIFITQKKQQENINENKLIRNIFFSLFLKGDFCVFLFASWTKNPSKRGLLLKNLLKIGNFFPLSTEAKIKMT